MITSFRCKNTSADNRLYGGLGVGCRLAGTATKQAGETGTSQRPSSLRVRSHNERIRSETRNCRVSQRESTPEEGLLVGCVAANGLLATAALQHRQHHFEPEHAIELLHNILCELLHSAGGTET